MALAIFPVFGYAGTGLDAHAIVDLLLAIFPTNIVTPFVENNYPQLVVLDIATGSVLLVLGSQVKTLATCLGQAKAGLNELMGFALRFAPVIPFVSIFMIAAQNRVFILVEGWRYIAGVYACYAICLTAKLIKVSRRSRIGIPTLWRTMAPVISTAFVSGSVVIATRSSQELVEREFGVQEDFSSFWVPLSQAMLSPNSTIVFTLVPFFVASACGQTLSAPMLVALLIISIELSLATPGAVVGITTQLSALGLPADYVGLFSAYGVFIRNASSAFTVAFRMLEELDAAYALGAVDAK